MSQEQNPSAFDTEAAWQLARAQLTPVQLPQNPMEELRMKIAFADGVAAGINIARRILRPEV